MTDLLTADDLAEMIGGPITSKAVLRWTRERGWPHVKFSSRVIRFTPEQAEQIVATYVQEGDVVEMFALEGQTRASRRRSA